MLTTPNYPNPYRSRDVCVYTIRVPNARQIVFYFADFTSEINKDAWEYGVGQVADFRSSIILYEGNLTAMNMIPAPTTVDVSQDPVWFYWSTDRNIQYTGVDLRYVAGRYSHLFRNNITSDGLYF